MTKTQSRKIYKSECGTKTKRTLSGRKTNKTSLQRKKLERRPTKSGRRNSSFLFPRLEKSRTMSKSKGRRITGRAGEWLGTGGKSPSPKEKYEEET